MCVPIVHTVGGGGGGGGGGIKVSFLVLSELAEIA